MASTQARQTARARARAAQQAVLVERKRRDDANMASLTDYFAAADQLDAARLAMAHAVDAIRSREGTLAAAATLTGMTIGEARKLVALLQDPDPSTSDTGHERGSGDTENTENTENTDGATDPDVELPAENAAEV